MADQLSLVTTFQKKPNWFSQSQDNKNLSQTTTSDKLSSPLFSLLFL